MTDWNDKLALLLYGLSATALGTDPAAAELPLLKGQLSPERTRELRDRFELAMGWVRDATDRAPLAPEGAPRAPAIDWLKAPELTHPISSSRIKLEALQHPERVHGALDAALDELASRFAGDARRQALWIWRYLPERLARVDGGLQADWLRFPADARTPHISAWHQAAACAALAGAAPDPAFLTFELSMPELGQGPRLADLRAASAIQSLVCWQVARMLVEELGPWCITQPSLAWQPQVDQWLHEQGVAEGKADELSDAIGFGGSVTAIVPLASVEELGARCMQVARSAWTELAAPVRAAIDSASGGLELAAAWERQLGASLDAKWSAVPIEDDSTGAGALLAGRDISLYEKSVKQRRDASGQDLGGKGVFLGLWADAARAAAEARRYTGPTALEELEPLCTSCHAREALGGTSLWKSLRESNKWPSLLDEGEALCGPCAVQRLGPFASGMLQGINDPAALLMSGDALGALYRGGLDPKEGATVRASLHSQVPAQLLKARSRWRDALDAPLLGGPCRSAAVAEALGAFSNRTARSVVGQAQGTLLAVAGDELTAVVPRGEVLSVASRLREMFREPFVQLEGTGRALHPGKAASSSCAIVIAPRASMPQLIRKVHRVLRSASETLGRSGLTIVVRANTGREYVLAARWDEVAESLEALVGLLRGLAEPWRLVSALSSLSVALTDTDLERSKNEPRMVLVRSIVAREAPTAAEPDRIARAILTLIDRNSAASLEADAQRGMDGIHVAGFLAEGVQ